MIKINKPAASPKVLLTRGEKKKRALCEAYEKGKTEFKSDEFDGKIYSHRSVKELLHTAQHRKCCYCESYIDLQASDVEHFRPKTHYYWLAYNWSNLLLSCMECNQRYKKDQFPLKDSRFQAQSHHDLLTRETPLLINPAEVNPARYIVFRNQYVSAIKDNPIGETTIEVLELNREALWKKRRNQLKHLEDLLDMIDLTNGPEKRRAQRVLNKLLKEYTQDSSEFTATIRCAKKRKFFPRTI